MTATSTGREATPANIALARRQVVQSIPFAGMGRPHLEDDHLARTVELGRGYLATKTNFSQALREQHIQAVSDLRELGFHAAADRSEERLGAGAPLARFHRER